MTFALSLIIKAMLLEIKSLLLNQILDVRYVSISTYVYVCMSIFNPIAIDEQGKGIFLTRTFDNIPQHENVVAQVYIKKPLLLDGYKFDLRICTCYLSLFLLSSSVCRRNH